MVSDLKLDLVGSLRGKKKQIQSTYALQNNREKLKKTKYGKRESRLLTFKILSQEVIQFWIP